MQYDLLIFGASGHAKVACDCAAATCSRIAMLSGEDTESRWNEIEIIPESERTLEEWKALCPRAFVAIGSAQRREFVTRRLEAAGFELVTLCHPSAVVSPSAELGEGTLVCPGAIINADAIIGKGCIVNSAAVVEHECVLGDFVHVSPGAKVCGNVRIGRASWICTGAAVANGLVIGSDTVVGAGAVVIDSLPDGVLAVGVPAVIKKRK